MSETTIKAVEIPKEQIPNLKFSDDDVLKTKEDIFQRKIDLNRASALGAQSKSNIKIYFVDNTDKKYKVVATVWAATERNVSLKGEVMVPIRAIYKVGFF